MLHLTAVAQTDKERKSSRSLDETKAADAPAVRRVPGSNSDSKTDASDLLPATSIGPTANDRANYPESRVSA
jgi:hypothetical protein